MVERVLLALVTLAVIAAGVLGAGSHAQAATGLERQRQSCPVPRHGERVQRRQPDLVGQRIFNGANQQWIRR